MTDNRIVKLVDTLCADSTERMALDYVLLLADLYEHGKRTITVHELCDKLGWPAPLENGWLEITEKFVEEKAILIALLESRNTPLH